jgi:drug/metabolite transporter (DMT)-like permease
MSNKLKVNLMAFCTVLLWASAFPITKLAMSYFSPNSLGFLRCSVGAIVLAVIGRINHIKGLRRENDILWFILSGGAGFALYMITFNTGIQTLTSATSSIIIALTPILTAALASRLYHERIKPLGWCMIGLAFSGVVVLLLWEGVMSINVGMIWTMAAAVVFSIYNIVNHKLSSMGYTALEIVTYSMICAVVLLAGFSARGIHQLTAARTSHILAVVYLGAMPSATAYFLWGKAMTLADSTSEVTNYMFVTPLLSTIMGFILLHELPNAGTFIGGAIIIASVVVFSLKGR